MKFATSAMLAATLALTNAATIRNLSSSSADVEGESSIKNGDCELVCSWGANNRRMLKGSSFTTVEFPDHRTLAVELVNVECTLTIDEVEYEKELEFPDGWVEVYKEGDGADDFYGFTKSFEITSAGTSLATGSLTVELNNEEITSSEDLLKYDDQGISVSCSRR